MRVHGEPFPVEMSACDKCKKLMRRVVVLVEMESYGLDEESIRKDLDIPDNEDVKLFQFICLVNNQELDGIVIKCNHFETNKKSILDNILSDNFKK